MNPSLAEYRVPVHLDVPRIEAIHTDVPDPHATGGAHGIGEIGTRRVCAAIANAAFGATGKRVGEVPITPDKRLRRAAGGRGRGGARVTPGAPEETSDRSAVCGPRNMGRRTP